MAKYRITNPAGETFEITAPDDATPDQVLAYAQQNMGAKPPKPADAGLEGGIAHGILQGVTDLPVGVGQALQNTPVVGGAINLLRSGIRGGLNAVGANEMAQNFSNVSADEFNGRVQDRERDYEAQRKAAGRDGFDAARLLGNVVNPMSMIGGGTVKAATTLPQMLMAGAKAGMASGMMQPVSNGNDFWTEKSKQGVVGAAGGAVATPVAIKAGQAMARGAGAVARAVTPAKPITPEQIQIAFNNTFNTQGMRIEDVPQAIQDSVRKQIAEALAAGRKINPEHVVRKAEFDLVGLSGDAAPTLGQLTMDTNPMQWAREKNLSGVVLNRGARGEGNDLADLFQRQNTRMGAVLDDAGAKGAPDAYTAGEALIAPLKSKWDETQQGVRAGYDAFKAVTGKDLDVPLQGLAQDYASTLRDFGDNIPSAVRREFEGLGLMGGEQRKVFSIEDAERLIKTINKNYDPMKAAEKRSLDELRTAVQKAVEGIDADGIGGQLGAEAADLAKKARSTASEAFKMRESAPALDAAVKDVAPDQFVRSFILGKGADAREVRAMKYALQDNPEAIQTARQQIAAHLKEAAFKNDMNGVKGFAVDRFKNALDAIGKQKLELFFSPEEIVQLNTLAKVAQAVRSEPMGAQYGVNRSGTAAALLSMLGKLGDVAAKTPFLGPAGAATVKAIGNQVGAVKTQAEISKTMAPQLAKDVGELSAGAVEKAQMLGAGLGAGTGVAAAQAAAGEAEPLPPGIPAGSRKVGDAKGRPGKSVYLAPNGKRYIYE